MIRYNLKDIFIGTFKTVLLLIFLEIIASSFFPAIGFVNFRPPFIVLIVLYVAFKINDSTLPYIILVLQNIHSIFSIEGWAVNTLIGLIVALVVKYAKDLLDFSNAISTIIVVQVSQLIWFLMLALLLSIKLSDFSNFMTIFLEYLPESFFISLVSPFFFIILDKLWITKSISARA